MSNKNEIEKVKPQETALAVPQAADIMAAFDCEQGKLNVPVGAVLPIVRILRESPKFEMPDGEVEGQFRGYILYYHSVNQLYLEEFGENSEGKRPDCSSCDGLVPCSGHFDSYEDISLEEYQKIVTAANGDAWLKDITPDHPAAQVYLNKVARLHGDTYLDLEPDHKHEVCQHCPAFQFGSKSVKENNKACQNSIWLYILIDGYQLPVFLKAGPSSLNRKDSLIPFLSNAPNIGLSGMYQTISVQFSLTTKKFGSGYEASCLILSDPKVLNQNSEEDVAKLFVLMEMYQSFKKKYLDGMMNFVAEDRGKDDTSAWTLDDEVAY